MTESRAIIDARRVIDVSRRLPGGTTYEWVDQTGSFTGAISDEGTRLVTFQNRTTGEFVHGSYGPGANGARTFIVHCPAGDNAGAEPVVSGGLHVDEVNPEVQAVMAERPVVPRSVDKENAHSNLLRPSAIVIYGIATTVVLQQGAGKAATPFDCTGLFASSGSNGSSAAPDRGDCFNDGSQDFLAAAGSMQKDFPQVWCGEAAEGYADGTKTLVALAQQMSDLDQQMAATVQLHGSVVEDTQAGIAFEQDFLGGMLFVVVGLELTYPAMRVPGSPLWLFALGITGAAILACLGCLIACNVKSAQHAAHARTLAYDEVAAAARGVAARYALVSAGSVSVASPTRFTYFEDMPETHAVVSAGRLRGFDQARTAVRGSAGQGQHAGATSAEAAPMPPSRRAGERLASSAPLSSGVTRQGQRAVSAPAAGPAGTPVDAVGLDISGAGSAPIQAVPVAAARVL